MWISAPTSHPLPPDEHSKGSLLSASYPTEAGDATVVPDGKLDVDVGENPRSGKYGLPLRITRSDALERRIVLLPLDAAIELDDKLIEKVPTVIPILRLMDALCRS
jgi:hypothetical protein